MAPFKYIVSLLVSIYILSSCTHTYIIPTYQAANYPQSKKKGSKWVVHASSNVLVTALVKTFEKVYIDNSIFSSNFGQQMVDSLTTMRIKAIPSSKCLSREELEKAIIAKKLNKSIILPNDTIGPDYVAYISDLEVSSYFRQTYNGMSYGSSSIEVCVVKFKFDLIDPSNNSTILTFYSEGQCSVSFFDYANIMQQSVKKAIHHAIAYLKTGKTEYTELY